MRVFEPEANSPVQVGTDLAQKLLQMMLGVTSRVLTTSRHDLTDLIRTTLRQRGNRHPVSKKGEKSALTVTVPWIDGETKLD